MNSLSTFQIVTMIIGFLAGVLANAKQTGKFFGIVTEPASWVPYVAIAAAFLPSFGGALQQAGAITVQSVLNAILVAITQGGGSLAAGVAAHHVFVAHTYGKSQPANGNGGGDKSNTQTAPPKAA